MKQKYKQEATENVAQTINNKTTASLGLGAVELKDIPPMTYISCCNSKPQPSKIIFSFEKPFPSYIHHNRKEMTKFRFMPTLYFFLYTLLCL